MDIDGPSRASLNTSAMRLRTPKGVRPAESQSIEMTLVPASCAWSASSRSKRLLPSPDAPSIVTQRHQCVACRFDSSGAATTLARPAAAGECASFDLRLKFFQKPHKENEAFQTENLSINTHT